MILNENFMGFVVRERRRFSCLRRACDMLCGASSQGCEATMFFHLAQSFFRVTLFADVSSLLSIRFVLSHDFTRWLMDTFEQPPSSGQGSQPPQQPQPSPQGAQSPQPPQYHSHPRYTDYADRRERRRFRWWIPVLVVFGVIFGIIVLFASLVVAVGTSLQSGNVTVDEHSVLHLKASGTVEERTTLDFLSALDLDDSRDAVTFLDVLNAVKRAKSDDNIEGIYFRAGDLKLGFAKATELREALVAFKASGKFIHAFIETGDERDYFLASVADSVFMPTEGLMEMNGFVAKGVFLKGALDKIGVEFYVQQFEEYKSFGEQYSRTSYSEPAKEELRALLAQRLAFFVEAVAQGRKMPEASVRAALERGIYTADSLLALGFIDGIRNDWRTREGVRNEAYKQSGGAANDKGDKGDEGNNDDKVSEKTSNKADDKPSKTSDKTDKKDSKSSNKSSNKLRLVALDDYLSSDSYRNSAGEDSEDTQGKKTVKHAQIALIAGTGAIMSGGNPDDDLVASAFIKQLHKARDNESVKAIVLRIDSPGGSVIASDAIWEEIRRVRAVKPVYASMSDVAASGGYYIAMPCDTIIAHRATVTGSIGVILTLPLASKLVSNLGVTLDTVQTSSASTPYDPALTLTEQNRKRIFLQSEAMYKRFVSRVAESRHLSYEDARAVAKGRVWTGSEAKRLKLVDTLGGLQTALAIAKRRIGVPESERVTVRIYPENKKLYERLIERFLEDKAQVENGQETDADGNTNADENADANADANAGIFRSFVHEISREVSRNLSRILSRSIARSFVTSVAMPSSPQTSVLPAVEASLWQMLSPDMRAQMLYVLKLTALARTEPTMVALPQIPQIY
jgi:protease IV